MTRFAFLNKTVSYALPVALMLGMSMTASAAKIYKWVDENGHTHYSQTPPPKKAKAGKALNINTSRSQPTPAQLAVTGGAPELAKGGSEVASKDKPNPDAERAKKLEGELAAQKKSQKEQQCQTLKRNMDDLRIGGQIYDMKNGERNYLSGKQIDERLGQVRDAYNRNCR